MIAIGAQGQGSFRPANGMGVNRHGSEWRVGAGHRIAYRMVGAKHPVWDALVHGLCRFWMLRPYKNRDWVGV